MFICHGYCCTRQFPWRRGCLSAIGTVVLGSSHGGEGVYLPWVLLYSAVPLAARVFICHRYCCTRQFPWRRGCLSAMGGHCPWRRGCLSAMSTVCTRQCPSRRGCLSAMSTVCTRQYTWRRGCLSAMSTVCTRQCPWRRGYLSIIVHSLLSTKA